MKPPLLIGLDYSPWTQKAGWALCLRGIPFRFQPYTPTLDEPGMRLRLGRLRGRISVPVLMDGRDAIEGSLSIARWAAERGRGVDLFPAGCEVEAWDARSERALAVGRRRTIELMVDDDQALDEATARKFPAFLVPVLRPVARGIARRTMHKYDVPRGDALPDALDALREALEEGDYVFGDGPSYADVVMAIVLEVVAPGPQTVRGPAELRVWTEPELAARYPDLVAYRDRLIEQTGFEGLS